MRNLLIIFLLALTVSCQTQTKKENKEDAITTNPPDSAHLIVPGVQLGSFVINRDIKPTLEKLGRPNDGDMAMGKALRSWKKVKGEPLVIYSTTQMGVEKFSRIKVVRSLSSKFRTKENLKVGSKLSDIEKEYSILKSGSFTLDHKSYELYISSEGIGFEIDKDGVCHGIVVMEKNSSPQQNYIPVYANFEPAE